MAQDINKIDCSKIYTKVLDAQIRHNKFLMSTEKNLSYYIFGRDVPLVKTFTFPQIDLVQTLQAYQPEAYNPLAYFVDAFIEELANSELRLSIKPFPVASREPYEAFADQLEDYLQDLHSSVGRDKFKKSIIFELLSHSYFGIYTNGHNYWLLTAYDLIPGDELCGDPQAQPFWARRTQITKACLSKVEGIDLGREEFTGINLIPDLDLINVYDVWIKDLDLNVCFTGAGQILYKQRFPHPKRYPFFIGKDGSLANNFYNKPLMNSLRPLLKKHQDALKNIEEHSKSVANPILTYDADAGIDVNMLQRALMEGWKRIIVGKNREGKLEFNAPGHLPAYALSFPDLLTNQMMKFLGITDSFLGMPTKAIRERGAIGRLIKTSFRKLRFYASVIENTFSELDNYLLDYVLAHETKFKGNPKFKNLEQIFQEEIKYVATERFKGFWSEDTKEFRDEAMIKGSRKLIPQEETLRELGYNQPRRMLEAVKREERETQKFALEMKEMLQQRPKSLWEDITDRLKGQTKRRFFISPLTDDKVLIRCSIKDQETVAFLLSDIAEKVMIEPLKITAKALPLEKFQKVEREPSSEEPVKKVSEVVETRGRPKDEPVGGEALQEAVKKLAQTEESLPEKKTEVEAPIKEVPQEKSPSASFSEEKLKSLIRRSTTLKRPTKFLSLPGLYLVEPHAKWINSGKKSIILKSRKLDIINKPHLLCGRDLIYGVIIIREIIEDFDIEATRKFHLITSAQQENWWKNQKVYLYLFEYHPFEKPVEYKRPEGVQTFIKKVDVPSEDIGVPFSGDIKPVGINPWKIPPPHKPEKKTFQPHEVFNLEKLKEIIPEATYDVSEKIDGLRCFAWVNNGEARMYSDVGSKFGDERVRPLLDGLKQVFKHNVLVDGELVMEDVRRKDVAGYIHGKWKPKPEELKALRYICWDILYVKDRGIASKPFSTRSSVLDLYLRKGCKGPICRVEHLTAKRNLVGAASKKLASKEGSVIRDLNASYWATHSTYKMKYQFDVDAKVIMVEKTKTHLPVFHCILRDGTYIGQTYAQGQVKAKPGDVIRVNVDHISIRPDGSIGWFAPSPKSWKEGKITPKKISTTQVGIGGPDTMDLVKEIYLVSGGTQDRWDEWYPKYKIWKKEKMPALIERLKEQNK